MILLISTLILSNVIAVPFGGIPIPTDDQTQIRSHGATLRANRDGVDAESTTVFRNPTATARKIWVMIPRFALGWATPDFDVTAEMGVPQKDGTINVWQPLTPQKAPQLADRVPMPDVEGKGEVDWGRTCTSRPLLVAMQIPANGTRPLRLRFHTALGTVNYQANAADTGYRGAAYSLATDREIDLLSGSITCGEGLFVPIPQSNLDFQIGTAGTAYRQEHARRSALFMKLLLFAR